MTPNRRSLTLLGLAAASVVTLAGCAGTPAAGGESDGRLSVVASTNVYGQLAEQIGGDLVEVTSIVTSDSQDPHSFEPSARDQLTVSDADLIIENGGGYDSFIDALIESSGSEAHVITAVEFSHDWPENAGHEDEHADEEHTDETVPTPPPGAAGASPGASGRVGPAATDEHAEDEAADGEHAEEGHDHDHEHVEGFNEHVWYDPHTIAHVGEAIAEELGELSPDDASTFTANAEALYAEIEGLEGSLGEIASAHQGAQIFVTEPVPAYLAAAAGLENVTPEAFSEAVEEGQDVAPATLLEALGLIESGDVGVVITNTQTGGAETTQIVDAAEAGGIPVIAFSETLPEGQTYISWMQANIEALSAALDE
ncbi:zinc ABC transporter solute-binding protein [Microbacterium sp. CFH 90308]|uniref:Zinc ABC transporter solute-binding protein n=1 Tax=Microbacterium salsuginis TaxID=2722803 RepID=A0ABX1KHC7_9MICO|nr:zinc ABC transporter substrate-binding protein [Microbacterium sp. CFH 90308]NLP84786.1 zinc ABC transporter solute-binding protein [Microbacterium sp. CFH 90308]